MTKEVKILLVKRSLALRHKLKVYDSTSAPSTHEDLALHHLTKWKLEDELKDIDQLLAEFRYKM